MTVTTEEMIAACIAKLQAEGINAFMGADPENEGNQVLLAPSLQNSAGDICQMRVYGYLSCKLNCQKRKGLMMRHPVSGEPYDIYVYDPESREDSPDASELMVWSVHEGHPFDWTELSLGDAGWDNGWELIECDHIEQRLAFLSYLTTCEVIDLPEPEPLTVEELREVAASEISKGNAGRFCYAPIPSNQWHLKLDAAGELVMSMSESQQLLKITAEHIDAQGRLVIDGHVVLTRSTPL
ncbi:hypothetical protein NPS53_08975 [Pseudomonas putida]|uniref:hypothetical protein n=1 Tax=Pseudomonas putida TaxID=303 RepID=UPI002363BD85|nr:hypothetical protein [Pseudomonas putida]MDD2139707.1 hypothetical protein [Pseudomonas putida]HDS1721631.1 hypothetical protein [Pseudomonas putida]